MLYNLKKILNLIPILNISDDLEFGFLDGEDKNLRYSLIAIYLGKSIIYLLTYCRADEEKNFRFHKYLPLRSILPVYTKDDIEERRQSFVKKIYRKSLVEKEIMSNFYSYKINELNNEILRNDNKIGLYIAINVVYFPLMLKFVSMFIENSSTFVYVNIFMVLLICYAIYYSINNLVLIYNGLQLRAYWRSTVASIREESSLYKELSNKFIDFVSINNQDRFSKTLIKITEKYFVRSFGALVLLYIIFIINSIPFNSIQITKPEYVNEFVIFNSAGDFCESQFSDFLTTISDDKEYYLIGNPDSENYVRSYAFLQNAIGDKRLVKIELQHNFNKNDVVIKLKR